MANANGAVLDGQVNVLNLTATAAYEQGDLVFIGAWFGQVLNDAAIGDTVSLDVEPYKRVQAISSVDGVGDAVGDAVYLSTTSNDFVGTAADGYSLVGYVTQVKDSNNTFQFEKLRYPVAYSA